MNNWTIYYNPKCGTCRNALEVLRAGKVEPRVVEYLKTPPSLAELKEIAGKLGDGWEEMVRAKEPIYEELKLGKGKSREEVLRAIVDHPILLQRPIVVHGNRAIVARPYEKVKELL